VTSIQRWALSYLLVEEREEQIAAEERQYKMLLSIHNPEALAAIERKNSDDDGSGEEGFLPDNLEEIEAYLKEIGAPQVASAAEDDEEDWL